MGETLHFFYMGEIQYNVSVEANVSKYFVCCPETATLQGPHGGKGGSLTDTWESTALKFIFSPLPYI